MEGQRDKHKCLATEELHGQPSVYKGKVGVTEEEEKERNNRV